MLFSWGEQTASAWAHLVSLELTAWTQCWSWLLFIDCDAGWWGPNCTKVCQCSPINCTYTAGCLTCANSGFTGADCDLDVNECTSGSYGCPNNSDCYNTAGSYDCVCRDWYQEVLGTCECKFYVTSSVLHLSRYLYSAPIINALWSFPQIHYILMLCNWDRRICWGISDTCMLHVVLLFDGITSKSCNYPCFVHQWS